MEKVSIRNWFTLLARLGLAAAFLLAAFPKIQDPVAFAASIEGYRVVEAPLTQWLALILPWLELVIGIGLLVPRLRRGSGSLIILLLVVFIGLHISAWARGLEINCGCYGLNADTEKSTNYLWLICRNILFLAAAILVFWQDWRNPSKMKLTESKSVA